MNCYQFFIENMAEIKLLEEGADRNLATRTTEGRLLGNAMTRSGLVLLCGYFEGYIRDVIEEVINTINDRKPQISALPEQLFCEILESMPEKHETGKFSKLTTLKQAIKDEKHHKLELGKLAKTGGNPTVDTIESIFSGIGITEVIEQLSVRDFGISSTYTSESQAEALRPKITEKLMALLPDNTEISTEIIQVIESKWGAKKKRREVGYVNVIQELLKKRNRVAHGEGKEPITPNELCYYRENIEKLAAGLNDLADQLLEGLRPPEIVNENRYWFV